MKRRSRTNTPDSILEPNEVLWRQSDEYRRIVLAKVYAILYRAYLRAQLGEGQSPGNDTTNITDVVSPSDPEDTPRKDK